MAALMQRSETIIPRWEPRATVVTGIGASEGPARFLANQLREAHGLRAHFAPLSSFVMGAPEPRNETLVIFSQALSPNARLAIRHASAYARAILFTSLSGSDDAIRCAQGEAPDLEVVTLPPETEQGTMLRIIGPAISTLAAQLYAARPTSRACESLVQAVRTAPERARHLVKDPNVLARRTAFVTTGSYVDCCKGMATKWLEGLFVPEPPIWDVLQVAHGPFQQFFAQEFTLIALMHDTPEEEALFSRLEAMLAPDRHALIRVRSALPGSLAFFDHDAQANALLLQALTVQQERVALPRAGLDAPLYGIERAF